MDMFESKPLLDVEVFQDTNTAFQLAVEDSSSGYDSSDLSDSESVSSTESMDYRESSGKLAAFKSQEEEVMKFRSTNTLCDSLKLILAMPELCDVTFLVGPNAIPVHGVRAILGTRSRIFYQLIIKHQSLSNNQILKMTSNKKITGKQSVGLSRTLCDRLIIPVKKYDAEVFRMLIEFVHCGSVNICEETVVGLFCGACQFQLQDLTYACLDFVDRCLAGKRFEVLLSSARCYSHHKAAQTIFEKIYSVSDRRYKKELSKDTV